MDIEKEFLKNSFEVESFLIYEFGMALETINEMSYSDFFVYYHKLVERYIKKNNLDGSRDEDNSSSSKMKNPLMAKFAQQMQTTNK